MKKTFLFSLISLVLLAPTVQANKWIDNDELERVNNSVSLANAKEMREKRIDQVIYSIIQSLQNEEVFYTGKVSGKLKQIEFYIPRRGEKTSGMPFDLPITITVNDTYISKVEQYLSALSSNEENLDLGKVENVEFNGKNYAVPRAGKRYLDSYFSMKYYFQVSCIFNDGTIRNEQVSNVTDHIRMPKIEYFDKMVNIQPLDLEAVVHLTKEELEQLADIKVKVFYSFHSGMFYSGLLERLKNY
ncbi:hypothetical protein [Lonepinella sp. MS14437]|uniref:hypothetical protein n=1 Tax=Lonepinella sp. MS14437 TaxID=3003620 RepID=UPI0036DDF43E